jgi:citrate lyase subunit beta/citryl-CoA lyase
MMIVRLLSSRHVNNQSHTLTSETKPYRSFLFMPGHKLEWMLKAPKYGADALIFDLDDAVPAASKQDALAHTAAAIDQLHDAKSDLFVRTSPWGDGRLLGDVTATVRPGLSGIVLSRTVDSGEVRALDLLLTELEATRGLPTGSVEIVPLCEDAGSLRQAYEILTSSPRVRRVFGVGANAPGGDVNRSVGYEWTEAGLESLYIAEKLVLDARAAGLSSVITGVVANVLDLDGLRRQMRFSKQLGANGAQVIHPSHVPIVNEIFSPTAEEIADARALLGTMAAAQQRGDAAAVHNGRMIDLAHARSSLGVLRRAEAFGLAVGEYPRVDV